MISILKECGKVVAEDGGYKKPDRAEVVRILKESL